MASPILISKNGEYFIEDFPVNKMVERVGSPFYVYSKEKLITNFNSFKSYFNEIDHLICFAVKSNSNIGILNILAEIGAGFDIVSGGELERVISAKGDPKKIVFSGVGKTEDEIRLAISHDILAFNVESESELLRIQYVAKSLNKKASISIRVNPNVDAKTHPYISTGLKDNKFGVNEEEAIKMYKKASKLDAIEIKGIDCHIGSQITDLNPFKDAIKKLVALIDYLKSININIDHVDIGGGLGICYKNENPPTFEEYSKVVYKLLKDKNIKIIFEPGRALVANVGALITKVEYIKKNEDKKFAITDAAMNDLMRPALYDAFHNIINLSLSKSKKQQFDIVGPICETSDFLGKNRMLSLEEGNILAILDAGAYGMTMSSNYNSRPKIPELMVVGNNIYVIRERESYQDLIRGESLLPKAN
jgi:diaminopimelate decarboxylase